MNIFQKIIIYAYSFILTLIPAPKYTEGVTGQPVNFLPSQAQSAQDKTISKLLFRGLFKYDIYGTLVPDLADTWSISQDGLEYTVHLKPNQKWINGQTVNADDLIYTAFKTPDLSGVSTDKIDNLTVRYTLQNKYSPFLDLLTVGVMPANSLERADPMFPVTDGDFRVGRIKRNGPLITQVILVSANRSYNIKQVIFRYYSNHDELVTAAKLGEIDAFLSDSETSLENFTDYKFPLQGIYYALFFNLRNPKLQDAVKRQNLQKALPLDKLAEDKGIFVQGPISRSLFTDQALNFNPYDSTLKADMSDLDLTLTIPDTQTHRELAKRIRDYWKSALGVNLEIRTVPVDQFVDKVITPRNFEVVLYGQEVGRDPDRYVLWHSTQADAPGLNITGFNQVRADRALEAGRDELDSDKRVVHYDEFQKVIVDQVPAIFLYHPYTHFYVNQYIQGIGQKYTFTQYDRFLDFANWTRVETD